MSACPDRVGEEQPQIQAYECLDAEGAIRATRRMDRKDRKESHAGAVGIPPALAGEHPMPLCLRLVGKALRADQNDERSPDQATGQRSQQRIGCQPAR